MGRLCSISIALLGAAGAARGAQNRSVARSQSVSGYQLSSLATSPSFARIPKEECPPCFNCLLPAFTCGQYGECNKYDGQCACPNGWGGQDCLTPQCDSLADGPNRRLRKDGEKCECKDNWGGLNCNLCKNDAACARFPLAGRPDGDDDAEREVDSSEMVCYQGGETVFNNHQACDVTNRGILDILDGRIPQVTFACERNSSSCDFQFWVDEVESFYCALDACTSVLTPAPEGGADVIEYKCEKMKCSCVPGRFICGENGSVDISDFLTDEIKGPGSFSCKGKSGCRFEEPAMNDLISTVFGDDHISLQCEAGECLHISQVPGFERPAKPDNTRWIALSVAGGGLLVIFVSLIIWYTGRVSKVPYGSIRLPSDESARLMTDHVPATLHFTSISYALPSPLGSSSPARPILHDVSGVVAPGEVLAIMGASGAGKSTFLDILARRAKAGTVNGTIRVNGRDVKDGAFRAVCGYVDQEDTLMRTLTVYETILYSALLRLPREMSAPAKELRVLETMRELGLMAIRDSRIGDAGNRGISGGEKRRVSIACELVTSPSILFLDEPTSGLDAYNAFNVVECLVNLAKNYKRTVVFTIHQPRSNIVALFDRLLVLAQGRTVYSGPASRCTDYLQRIGHPCPPGFNLADYLIDLTSQPAEKSAATPGEQVAADDRDSVPSPVLGDENLRDEERALRPGAASRQDSEETRLRTLTSQQQAQQASPSRASSIASSASGFVKRKTSQLFGNGAGTAAPAALPPLVAALVAAYAGSDIAAQIRAEGAHAPDLPDVAAESALLKGRRRAGLFTQFRILSGRAFKNLYRDPALLTTHYVSAFILALIAGFLYYDVENDIGGFQNRLGFFFFTMALFGFSCLSSLSLFHGERVLYMRERANGYYSSFTYFSAKVLFDILPLRVVPPFVFAAIAYPLIGLVPTPAAYWKFMLTLILFNLTTASVCLLLSVSFANIGVASFVGTLIMLFNLLFAGLLINRSKLPPYLAWLLDVSFFHAGFEALAVNELRYLKLHERKYGVDINVPAATILNLFGLRAGAFWFPDIALLAVFFAVFTTASYLMLHFYVKERR